MAGERAVPSLPKIPQPEATKPVVLVKLRGQWGSNMPGEVIGVSPEDAEYLKGGKFPKGHVHEGKTYAHDPHPDELKQISELKAWQDKNTREAEGAALRRSAGVFAEAVKQAKS